ncbi:ABC transporter permease [Halobacillus litoralis]|uniref:ABC transporter permease n=1 Tax=Halobacillus litoralis TaxID=45668 RepID=UPI002490F403|nr:FtsX-like permease family protein [Halobacillus litoralis]
MKWKDRLNFIRQNMKKNKSRVFMTILATAIGCAFLIVLASVGFGAQRFIVNDIMQDRSITEIQVQGKRAVEEGENPGVTKADIEKFEEIENVKAVSHKIMVENETTVQYEGYSTQSSARAVDFSAEKKAGLNLSSGEMPEAENEVIVGYHLNQYLHKEEGLTDEELYNEEGVVKEKYQLGESLLGKTIQMEVRQFKDGEMVSETFPLEVVGVAEEPARDWQKDRDVLISSAMLTNIESFTGTTNGQMIRPEMSEEEINSIQDAEQERTYQQVNVIASNMEQVESISQTLKDDGYHIYSVTEELDQINIVFAVVKTGLVIVGAIALLIASIGIFNTMSMAVTERTQDIGIMKAIGGHPKMIRSIFLMESGYIGLMGAIVGVIVAYLISFAINQILPIVIQQVFNESPDTVIQLSYIPPYLVLLCVALSIGVAMLSGMKPAKKATNIDVLRALRRDI